MASTGSVLANAAISRYDFVQPLFDPLHCTVVRKPDSRGDPSRTAVLARRDAADHDPHRDGNGILVLLRAAVFESAVPTAQGLLIVGSSVEDTAASDNGVPR